MTLSLKRIPDVWKARILRWWSIAAVYFFVGWGTNLGNIHLIDFVFYLGIAIGAFRTLVTEPVIGAMFNLEQKAAEPGKLSGSKSVGLVFGILKSMAILMVLIYLYALVNRLLLSSGNYRTGQVPIPGEPISFALLFLGAEYVMGRLARNLKLFFEKNLKGKDNDKD